MSLQFVFGPAGSGKSEYLQNSLIEESLMHKECKFLLIVPDQYSMQTQKDMVLLHPDRAFSNIEILSFSRLSHRILEEMGGENVPVLDDSGKSLIIRHISEDLKGDLKSIGKKLDRMGFITEVKSAISEFMQYGLTPEDVESLAEFAGRRPALKGKLSDLAGLYRAFREYKEGSFYTREETLDVVKRSLHKSELVRDSVLIFDGFTGFTPIEERVIQELMTVSKKICMSFDLDEGEDPYSIKGEQELFYLSKKSVIRLKKLADEASVEELPPIFLTREKNACYKNPELNFLEKNMFRYPHESFEQVPEHIRIYEASGIGEEITDTCQRIREYSDKKGLKFSEMAIVVGNLAAYAADMAKTAEDFDIPIYLDYSRSVLKTPFIEALVSAIQIVEKRFSREAVMRHLRCGFSPLTRYQCDELENFLLKTGIRGYKEYTEVWTVNVGPGTEETAAARDLRLEKMERLNSYRTAILDYTAHLVNMKASDTVRSYCTEFYSFLHDAKMQKHLEDMSEAFKKAGDTAKADEYRQIYPKVMKLLDQIVSLTGDETMKRDEFAGILEAGYGEIKLGVIPAQCDRVLVGDMERTRLSSVKVLFFMGVNDGNIPGNTSGGGLISDIDREFLKGSDMELAPTPKDKMYLQRLYLYMNLCKPTQELCISYADMDNKGKSLRPSYLIKVMRGMFPSLKIEKSEASHVCGNIVMPAAKHLLGMDFAGLMEEYAYGRTDGLQDRFLYSLAGTMDTHGMGEMRRLLEESAFDHYRDRFLSSKITDDLYKKTIIASVSRMEKYAACAYAHFLSYGMELKERPEFNFERRDMGDVFHKVLEEFALKLKNENMGWNQFTMEQADAWVDELVDQVSKTYGDTILLSSSRKKALSARMGRVIKRTLETIQYQLSKGNFVPEAFEKGFVARRDIAGTDIKMELRGKIDRIDVCRNENELYLNIIDYKTGTREFSLPALYHGLQLQLAVYMQQAIELEKKKYNGVDIIPAAMLYYHLEDPISELSSDEDDDAIIRDIHKKLKMKGIATSDRNKLGNIDGDLCEGASGKSDVIPASFNKDGAPGAYASVMEDGDIRDVLDFAEKKLESLATQIVGGNISEKPCMVEGSNSPCTYCDFKQVCRIDSHIPGYEEHTYEKEDDAAVLGRIKNELHD